MLYYDRLTFVFLFPLLVMSGVWVFFYATVYLIVVLQPHRTKKKKTHTVETTLKRIDVNVSTLGDVDFILCSSGVVNGSVGGVCM